MAIIPTGLFAFRILSAVMCLSFSITLYVAFDQG